MNDASLTARELAELSAFLRIPSISADPARAADVRAAADWLVDLIRAQGGEARIVERAGRPLVDALVRANRTGSGQGPPILCYGHFDVQPPGPAELWETDPFSPQVRDGWLYARGVADDKGQLWALLRGALDLRGAGSLPVDVRFCLDCEEEVGGTAIVDYLEETAGEVRACVIFDTAMLDVETPVLTIATRGTVYLHVEVRTGERDLHSGVYGGAALNALHVLVIALGRVMAHDGRVPEPLRANVSEPDREEIRAWQALPLGQDLLAAQGAVPADDDAPVSSISAPGLCPHSTSTASKAVPPFCRRRSCRRLHGRTSRCALRRARRSSRSHPWSRSSCNESCGQARSSMFS